MRGLGGGVPGVVENCTSWLKRWLGFEKPIDGVDAHPNSLLAYYM